MYAAYRTYHLRSIYSGGGTLSLFSPSLVSSMSQGGRSGENVGLKRGVWFVSA